MDDRARQLIGAYRPPRIFEIRRAADDLRIQGALLEMGLTLDLHLLRAEEVEGFVGSPSSALAAT